MKILKYEKKKNNTYKIYLEGNNTVTVYDDVIIKNNLLYKKEIDKKLLEKLNIENNKEDIYNKCIKYISVRIRSKYEIEEYLKNKQVELVEIEKTINKLVKSNLLDDDLFAKSFIHDKLNFTTMGPYRIEQELKKHRIDSSIIYKYLNDIDEETIDNKINKQINKIIKSTKKKENLKNKIYKNLLSLGYTNESILRNINKHDSF